MPLCASCLVTHSLLLHVLMDYCSSRRTAPLRHRGKSSILICGRLIDAQMQSTCATPLGDPERTGVIEARVV